MNIEESLTQVFHDHVDRLGEKVSRTLFQGSRRYD